MELLNQYLLSILIFFPLVAAVAVIATPSAVAAKSLALAVSTLMFLGGMHLWYHFDGTSAAVQFVESYEWLPQFNIRYIVGVDGLSLLLVVLTTFMIPLIILSQWHTDDERVRGYLALFLALESTMLGALLALDVVFFYLFWEAMLIPMYFLIGIWGGANRIYATTKFFIYTAVGSLLMLAAAVVLYHSIDGVQSTSLFDLYGAKLDPRLQMWLFIAFAFAFAIKIPLWPFHTWLPDAHVQAPTGGSVILAGILLKMGTYGFLRFAIPLFPEAVVSAAPILVGFGIAGIIYGALVAWVQEDAKKLVAYSSVSHLGFVVIGSLAFVNGGKEINVEALTGAVYQMINHGISTGALFFLVGVIYERRHTRMLKDFGGLASVMPWFAVFLIVAMLSSVGLPGTGGFVGEFLILLGVFQSSPIAGVFAATGVLLGAVYMLSLCKDLLFGPLDNEENKKLKDVNAVEVGYLLPLVILAVVMGIFPNLFLEKARPAIEHLAKNFSSYSLEVKGQNAVAENREAN